MFTRKPKNIVSKVIDLTTGLKSDQASHTWMSEDKTRTARFGSTSEVTFQERQQANRSRHTIGRYADSRVASVATRARGDISRAARTERDKIKQRFDTEQNDTAPISNPVPPQSIDPVSPVESSSFYPNFHPKL